MKCSECGASLRGGDKFCWKCGTEMTEPEKAVDLSPVVFKLLGGIGTGLKFLGEAIQEWAESSKGGGGKEEKND